MGLRARLTILVTLVFAVALSISAVLGLRAVERELVRDTRASAEAVLGSYLDSIHGGTAAVGVVDDADSTRFFYLDSEGNDLSEQEYFQIIAAGLEAEFQTLLEVEGLSTDGAVTSEEVLVNRIGPLAGAIEVNPSTGVLLDSSGAAFLFVMGPQPIGEPQRVEISDDVVSVAQTLTFANGDTFEVGVSSPLRHVTDSLDTFRRLLWFAVPSLVVIVAGITWLAASRALAPVHEITSRAREITLSSIDGRLPVNGANDEIGELATTMNQMLERLEGARHQQRQLVADASHELRSPVAASRAQLEVAVANPGITDWAQTAATVLGEQEHLSHLIDDLLALSGLQEVGVTVEEDVDLDDLIALEVRRPHLIPVRVSIEAPVRVTGDRVLLGRAIRNLVDNATRHGSADVLVTLTATDTHATIEVHDDGPGIHDDQRERIFDRFTRSDEARDRLRGGAGLGLAIVKEVALAHGGQVHAKASVLGGALFTLTIPLGVDR